jgi:hypothetical protein
MDETMKSQRDWLRIFVRIFLIAALVIGLLSVLGGWALLESSRRIAASYPPYPEGPPDAGVYGTLLGWAVLACGIPVALLLALISGILEFARRRSRGSPAGNSQVVL